MDRLGEIRRRIAEHDGELMNAGSVAEAFERSAATAYYWGRSGTVPGSVKIGGRRYFLKGALLDYVDELSEAAVGGREGGRGR